MPVLLSAFAITFTQIINRPNYPLTCNPMVEHVNVLPGIICQALLSGLCNERKVIRGGAWVVGVA